MCRLIVPLTSLSLLSVEATVNLAERLSSALTIYSNELTGLVILVDSQMLKSRDQQREFSLLFIIGLLQHLVFYYLGLAEVCELSTDFHFTELDRQLSEIREDVRDLPELDLSPQGKFF